MRINPAFMFPVIGITLAGVTPLRAQDESRERPPAFATGVTAGSISYSGGRTDQGVSVALQYSPREWLALSAAPGFGRSTSAGSTTTGLTDMPISAGAWHSFADVTLSPTISGSLYSSLSLGGSGGVGAGRSVVGAAAALSAWVTDLLHLTVGGARPLGANSGNGSLNVESSYSMGRATPNLGFSSEIGTPDSGAVLSRSLAAGVAWQVSGPLTLTVDASHGLSTSAPTWSVSVGFGTAFAGVSPVTLSSPLRRMKNVFGARSTAPSGYASSRGSCKRAGTC